MVWDSPVTPRDQIVLFTDRLDDVLPSDHTVRHLVAILDEVDWSAWEGDYSSNCTGRPPIHPRVMCGIILYGLMKGVRSSRRLEEALEMRLDFRWLSEGRSIDHSTLCRFRQGHSARLKELFVQVTLTAQMLDANSLVALAVDGTKIRANNHRSNKVRTKDLEQQYEKLDADADRQDSESAGHEKSDPKKKSKNKVKGKKAIKRAMAEAVALKKKGEEVPRSLPTTDVQSRVTKNKEGGYAPNYTPVNVVDVSSGMVVATDVIAGSDEKSVLPGCLDEIQEQTGRTPEQVLGDGIYNQSSNLIEMDQRNIKLYSPSCKTPNNPAIRKDLTKPVADDQIENLPVKSDKLTSEAFIYNPESDSYFCPQGKELPFNSTCNVKLANGDTMIRRRYHSDRQTCDGCPLKELCIGKTKSGYRRVTHDQAKDLRDELDERMTTDEGQTIYNRRMRSEHPFATIKQQMGLRQFLHRGLEKVKTEWTWATTAYNLMRRIFQKRSLVAQSIGQME